MCAKRRSFLLAFSLLLLLSTSFSSLPLIAQAQPSQNSKAPAVQQTPQGTLSLQAIMSLENNSKLLVSRLTQRVAQVNTLVQQLYEANRKAQAAQESYQKAQAHYKQAQENYAQASAKYKQAQQELDKSRAAQKETSNLLESSKTKLKQSELQFQDQLQALQNERKQTDGVITGLTRKLTMWKVAAVGLVVLFGGYEIGHAFHAW